MVEVYRKEHETIGAMMRRFSRKMQMSGILVRARQNRFFKNKPTKRVVRVQALRRKRLEQERMRLEKLGKEVEPKRGRR